MLHVLFAKQSTMVNVKEMREIWRQIETSDNQFYHVSNLSSSLSSPKLIKERLLDNNVVFMEEGRTDNGSPCLYFSAKTTNNLIVLVQQAFQNGDCILCVKSKVGPLIPLGQQ